MGKTCNLFPDFAYFLYFWLTTDLSRSSWRKCDGKRKKWKVEIQTRKCENSLSLPLFLKRRLAKTFIPRDRELSGTFWQARKMDGALFSEACVLLTRWQMTALYQGFEKGKLFLFLLFWLFCIQNVQKFRSEKCATYILLTLKSSILWLLKGRQNLKNLEAN